MLFARRFIRKRALLLLRQQFQRQAPLPQPESNKRVQDVKFFSKALQREMQYRVVLPKDYFTTENRYPVLYLLHGLTGHYRSFEAHSNLTRYLERYQLIAVSIEGENSWYINSATNPKEKWEDYFLQDVLSDVGERFRINGGDARAIAGISSGGYAAHQSGAQISRALLFCRKPERRRGLLRAIPEFDKAFQELRLY